MGPEARPGPHGPARRRARGQLAAPAPGYPDPLGTAAADRRRRSTPGPARGPAAHVRRAHGIPGPERRGPDFNSGTGNDALTVSGAGLEERRLLDAQLLVGEDTTVVQAGEALEVGYPCVPSSPTGCRARACREDRGERKMSTCGIPSA